MAEPKWALITSGETFEALASTIVFFEDAQAVLFGRRGKDGGQDVRSGDGKRVFQAKHHESPSATLAIADARAEAEKIQKYRKPEHARYAQWIGVSAWRLVTNAAFNATDKEKWDRDVVPIFAALGLSADYWGRTDLNARLDKYPEIYRSFFENETRALLSIPEAREQVLAKEPFLQRASQELFGRAQEITAITDFLSSGALFLVLHGGGGIGKTRLLLEAGEQIASDGTWQVLWANVVSMSASATWFASITPERPTLLLVDEPETEDLLRVLSEQLGGRASQWKVAVAVRSPKDPVLRFLFGPRMGRRVRKLPVGSLTSDAAEAMCADLLASGPLAVKGVQWCQAVARDLAHRFEQHPVWLTLAIHLLEEHSDLTKVPQDAAALADLYLDEIVAAQKDDPHEYVWNLLRWVALVGTVNREDDAGIRLLSERTGSKDDVATRAALATLVQRKALVQRGARERLVELKPDVLRDRVLLRWLATDVGYGLMPLQPSGDAQALVASVRDAVLQGGISPLGRSVLQSLGRTELIFRLSGQSVPLLDEFFAGVRSVIKDASASARLVLAEAVVDVAFYRPADVAKLSRTLRLQHVNDETVPNVFRTRTVGQRDVVLALAWPVFHAAMGAQTSSERELVLEELCDLAEAEVDIGGDRPPRNDGKRPADLLRRALEGGPQFWADFDEAAMVVSSRLLDHAATATLTPGKAASIKTLLVSATAMERRQTWADERSFHMQTSYIVPGQTAWATRQAIVARLKAILASKGVPRATRCLLWSVLVEAHRSANWCRGQGPEELRSQMRAIVLEDLVWAYPVLEAHSNDLDELNAARDLWDWHHQYDENPERKSASEALEVLYKNNDLAIEFEPLTSRSEFTNGSQRTVAKVAELAAASSAAEIDVFLERASRFVGGEQNLHSFNHLASMLGSKAPDSSAVRDFVKRTLAGGSSPVHIDFAACAAAGWASTTRTGSSAITTHELVKALVDGCGDDSARLILLGRVYGRFSPAGMSPAEHEYLRSLAPLFLRNAQGPAFVQAVGGTHSYAGPTLRGLLERVLEEIPRKQATTAFRLLLESAYSSFRDSVEVPVELAQWLLDQMVRVPDLDSEGEMIDWHMREILKRSHRPTVAWFASAIASRQRMEASDDGQVVRAIGFRSRLSTYVSPVSKSDLGNADIVAAVNTLVGFASDHGTVGYHLPAILHDVDPEGLLVPETVARSILAESDRRAMVALVRAGSGYAVGSQPWRSVARAVVPRAAQLDDSERLSLFSALQQHGTKGWSARVGEVPETFVTARQSAKELLDGERDPALKPFWEWYLAVADADLKAAEERAKEERGE
jgi:hypothetical protein